MITNGTAVLGLGNIGPLASKPVMEGKGCLFKKFAGIDVFDIELAENDHDKLIDIIAALEPTLGGINLEDIKAPECFYIERELKKRLKIPVFHDDQHGTAIISAAAMLNALEVTGKKIDQVKVVCSGAGAAAISCLDLWCKLGINRENVIVCDSKGVIYFGRDENMEENKARYARNTQSRTLSDAINQADIFLGLSTANVLSAEMVSSMNSKPIIFALANPNPEILPNIAKNTRPDAIVATGRSDFPNQVNNVLCFPFIFRGALDVGAQQITEEMKLACVHAIAELAHAEITDEVATTYSGQSLVFGSEYLIPKPFDPRLIISIAPKVAKAAMESGVATRPIVDFAAYQEKLQDFVYRTGFGMRNIFHAAKQTKLKKVIFSEGEEERILRAAQIVVEEKIAFPILIGRPDFINRLITKSNLNLRLGIDFELVDPSSDQRYRECWQAYHQWSAKDGVTPGIAKAAMRRNHSVIGATLLRLGYADALIAGGVGAYHQHLDIISRIIGKKPQVNNLAAMSYLMLPNRAIFISDTHVNDNPSAEDLVEISLMAAEEVRRFGITPKLALLSHSNFGSYNIASSQKMRKANELLLKVCSEKGIELEFDGEMHGDTALSQEIRDDTYPNSQLKGEANLLIMPNLDAANISYNLLKMTGSEGVAIGPILLGAALPVHVLTSSTNVRKMVNMTAIAVVDTENR